MRTLTHLSLFSGIGGLDLAAEAAGFVTVGQCEWADYPGAILEKHWPDIPRWKDIRSLTKEDFYERTGLRTVDIISGGFPCQPFSVAGKQKGKRDDRYLWPEMLRVIRELKPNCVIGENVPGILRIAAGDVVADLEREGYDVVVFDFEAAAVGAWHRRERIAFVGYAKTERDGRLSIQPRGSSETGLNTKRNGQVMADSQGKQDRGLQQRQIQPDVRTAGQNGAMADASCERLQRSDYAHADATGRGEAMADAEMRWEYGEKQIGNKARRPGIVCGDVPDAIDGSGSVRRDRQLRTAEEAGRRRSDYRRRAKEHVLGERWIVEPNVGRVAHGVSRRVDRLRCLGNAVVPQQFYPIFKAVAEEMRRNENDET